MIDNAPHHFEYMSMGTSWAISIWDDVDPKDFAELQKYIVHESTLFDTTYSRFIQESLVWALSKKTGMINVPADLVRMLGLYETLHDLSHGKLNPLIGFSLSDTGYDANYSLRPQSILRTTPHFHEALAIIDDTHIELRESVLIDLGALGKGYFVDTIFNFLREKGFRRFLVNGSGDIRYHGSGIPLRAGLEHPLDPSKLIGVMEFDEGAFCASASNRRAWGKYHHTLDPDTLTSPSKVIATWVRADTAALADGLCTCLMLTNPERFASLQFEYCLLNPAMQVKQSAGFHAELF